MYANVAARKLGVEKIQQKRSTRLTEAWQNEEKWPFVVWPTNCYRSLSAGAEHIRWWSAPETAKFWCFVNAYELGVS